jgi:hypothetical protein
MPVCYDFDATTNVLGYSKSEGGEVDCQTTPTTTDEGYHNEAKYLVVEDPDSTNLLWFAGVVASGSWCGTAGTGAKWIEIYVPNGAVVPVRTGVSTTVGRTVLCIGNGLSYFAFPNASVQGRPVAFAAETVTGTSGTPVLCLAKLSPDAFAYQTLNGTSTIVGTGVTTEITHLANRMYYSYAGTDGSLGVLRVMVDITGAGGSTGYGVLQGIQRISSTSQGTPPSIYAGVAIMAQTTFATGATGTGVFGALRVVSDNLDATPATVSGATVYNIISDLNMNTNAPATLAHMSFSSDGTTEPDYFFVAKDTDAVAAVACVGDVTVTSADKALKIKIGDTDYYLIAVDGVPGV